MSWLSRFFGEPDYQDSEPVEQHEPGEYKVHINTFAQGGDKFSIRALVYVWDTGWFVNDNKYDWRMEKAWDWESNVGDLDRDEAYALEYAQQYIENTRRNDQKVIHIP